MLYLPNRMRHLVTGSSDKQIRLWNIDTGDCIRVILEHKSSIKCLMLFGSDGHFCSGGEALCLWSPDGQLLALYGHEEENSINFMIPLTDGRVVTAMDKQLVVYSVETTQAGVWAISFYRKLPPHREAVRCLVNVSDQAFASGSIDGTISVWNATSLLQSRFFNSVTQYEGVDKTFPHSVEHMSCLSKRYLMVAFGAGFAIYDTENGQTIHKRENAHHSKINCITFTCGGLYLATAAVDGSIRLWSYVEVLKECISGDSNFFGTSLSPQSGIHEMWLQKDKNPHSLALVGECQAHAGAVQVILDCDGESLVSCGVDGLVIVWKNENIQMMKRSHILQTLTSCDGIV